MRLILEENPTAKARHRLGRGRVYDPQSEKKNMDRMIFKSQMFDKRILKLPKGPLESTLHFGISMPQSWSTRLKNKLRGQPCIARPDLDNYMKYYFDVLNEIAYQDDAHISRVYAEKFYVDEGYVEINLNSINE